MKEEHRERETEERSGRQAVEGFAERHGGLADEVHRERGRVARAGRRGERAEDRPQVRHRQVVGGDRQADPEDPVVDGPAERLVPLPQSGEDDHDKERAEWIDESTREGAAGAPAHAVSPDPPAPHEPRVVWAMQRCWSQSCSGTLRNPSDVSSREGIHVALPTCRGTQSLDHE
ncbi:hypothetical protein SHIRM173S_01004 [Streptomyces hirsutus]